MTKIKLLNTEDATLARAGVIAPASVRELEIEGLVDTGATLLALPAEVVEALGLRERERRHVRLADGTVRDVPFVGGIQIEILGRSMSCDALVLPSGATALIGQIPLEGLDLVVDPRSREAMPNPASPDVPTLDLLLAS